MNKRIFIVLFISCCCVIRAQELPPITSNSPEQYMAGNQNWGITQAKNLELFFANNNGLVVFNGNDWQLYPSPNKTIMRSVYAVANRVYSGCYMEFGYWEEDSGGSLTYTSLSDAVANELIEDENFWTIFHVDEYVLFQSLSRIYVYNTANKEISFIDTAGILKMYRVNNVIYFQDVNRVIYQISNGQATVYEPLSSFTEDRIINVFPNAEGLLLLTEKRGFFKSTPGGIMPWKTDLNAILAGQSVYSGIRLADSSYAIGTIANGLIMLNQEGSLMFQVDQSNGLNNNTVLSLMEDNAGNLWSGLDNGIDLINLKAPVKQYTDLNGKIGSVYSGLKYKDRLYLGTNQGLFVRDMDSDTAFEFIEGTNGQVWNLSVIDNTLFIGHNEGTLILEDGAAKNISRVPGTWNFLTIPGKDDYILQGTYTGLSYLTKQNGSWTFGGTLSGFDISARFVARESNSSFWVNHEYKGVYNLAVDLDQDRVLAVKRDTSLATSRNSGMVQYNSTILYANEFGVYKLDESTQGFVKDSLLSQALKADNQYYSGQLITDREQNLWLFGEEGFVQVRPSTFDSGYEINKISLSKEFRDLVNGFENVQLLEDGTYLFGTTNGYIVLDLNAYVTHANLVGIQSVLVQDFRGRTMYLDPKAGESKLKTSQNTVSFNVNTANYDNYLTKDFRFKLVGLEDSWSPWTEQNTVQYPGLKYGDYSFLVQSRVGTQISDNTATLNFTIAKPWYLSNWAIVFYFLGLGLLILLVNATYKWYYIRKQQALMLDNQKQLELQRIAAEREIMALKNDSLEQDVKNKNQELAISTMGIIRKNEVLNNIQKELEQLKDSTYASVWKRVNRIIDGSLNDNDDWQLFEEAFNNADKDFIDKIKAKYPVLTPNDLKLCAYLRLNLSSKEIAPLLNISTRSVEIRRYRLRKKMKLASGVNLVAHIMAI